MVLAEMCWGSWYGRSYGENEQARKKRLLTAWLKQLRRDIENSEHDLEITVSVKKQK